MNIKEFENVMFDVFKSNKETYQIKYVDFSEGEKTMDIPVGVEPSGEIDERFPHMPIPTIWNKSGNMNSLIIEKNLLDKEVWKTLLIENIQKDFLQKVEQLGEKNRLSVGEFFSGEKFDLNFPLIIEKGVIGGLTETETIARRILPQLIRCGSWIATNGRIGPGNYLIMNKDTYDYLEPYFETISDFWKKDQFDDFYFKHKYADRNPILDVGVFAKLSSFNIIVDKRVKDDIIIQGRKNGDHMLGVSAVVWSDYYGNVLYDNLEFKYNVIDVGFFPHKQYYSIHLIRNEN